MWADLLKTYAGDGAAVLEPFLGSGTCPPEECYPGALTEGRSPIAVSAEGANRGAYFK